MKLTQIVKIRVNLSRVNFRALNFQYFNPNFGILALFSVQTFLTPKEH